LNKLVPNQSVRLMESGDGKWEAVTGLNGPSSISK
jgi:hypothetical protein